MTGTLTGMEAALLRSEAVQLLTAERDAAREALAAVTAERDALRKALESEREECAKLCDAFDGPVSRSQFVNGQATAAQQIRARIRARAVLKEQTHAE